MALPTGIPEQEWKYYDFGANWSEFLRAWKSAGVQDVLFDDMQNWCRDHAFLNSDGSTPTWKRGEPLWHLSRTDYWAQKNHVVIDEHIERHDCFNKFKRTMEQQGRHYKDDEVAWISFNDTCWEQFVEDLGPQPDTLESMIMIMGGEYLYEALAATARRMELDEAMIQTPEGLVLLPSKKLVFDFMQYYFDVVEGITKRCLLSDADYDHDVMEALEEQEYAQQMEALNV